MAHITAAAFRADMDVIAPDLLQDFTHGKACQHLPELPVPLNPEDDFQVLTLTAVVQETIVTDFLKARRKDMHHQTADKFLIGKGDLP